MGGMYPEQVIASILDSVPYYQDPMRVKRDAIDLQKAVPSLQPSRDELSLPTGATTALLNLHGTLPIVYRGATYNIPVRLWVQEGYPRAPPLAYVEPTRDMDIKRGHAVVLSDGACKLRAWDPARSTLLHVAQELQGAFGMEPPVFARGSGGGGGGGGASKEELIEAIRRKLQERLTTLFTSTRDEIDDEFELQAKLDAGAETLKRGISGLRDTRRALETYNEEVGMKLAQMESWLVEHEAEAKREVDPFEAAAEPDVISRQLFRLVAEGAACEDGLFALDRALANDAIDAETFMKECRKLSRRQFEARYLAGKISEAMRRARYGVPGAAR